MKVVYGEIVIHFKAEEDEINNDFNGLEKEYFAFITAIEAIDKKIAPRLTAVIKD